MSRVCACHRLGNQWHAEDGGTAGGRRKRSSEDRGNPEDEGNGACGRAEGKRQLGVLGRDERIILKRVLKAWDWGGAGPLNLSQNRERLGGGFVRKVMNKF